MVPPGANCFEKIFQNILEYLKGPLNLKVICIYVYMYTQYTLLLGPPELRRISPKNRPLKQSELFCKSYMAPSGSAKAKNF